MLFWILKKGIKNELLLTQNDNLHISNTFSASKSILDGLCVKLNQDHMGNYIYKIKVSVNECCLLWSEIVESIIKKLIKNEFSKKQRWTKTKNEAAYVENFIWKS